MHDERQELGRRGGDRNCRWFRLISPGGRSRAGQPRPVGSPRSGANRSTGSGCAAAHSSRKMLAVRTFRRGQPPRRGRGARIPSAVPRRHPGSPARLSRSPRGYFIRSREVRRPFSALPDCFIRRDLPWSRRGRNTVNTSLISRAAAATAVAAGVGLSLLTFGSGPVGPIPLDPPPPSPTGSPAPGGQMTGPHLPATPSTAQAPHNGPAGPKGGQGQTP